MVVECHHVACVCGDWMKIPIFKEKNQNWESIGNGAGISAPENTKNASFKKDLIYMQ